MNMQNNELFIVPELVQVSSIYDQNELYDENQEETEVFPKEDLVNDTKKMNERYHEICKNKMNHLRRHRSKCSKNSKVELKRKENVANDLYKQSNESIEKTMDEECFSAHSKVKKSRNTAFDLEEIEMMKNAKEVNGRLQCLMCPRTLSNSKLLRLHIRSHIGKNLLHCQICNRGFAKGSNLNRHMLLHSSIDNDQEARIMKSAARNGWYCCPYCNKVLIDRQCFRLHIRNHISKSLIRCCICSYGFENDEELEKHMASHEIKHNINSSTEMIDLDEVNRGDELNRVRQTIVNGDEDETLVKKCVFKQLELHKAVHMSRKKKITCDICMKCFNRTDSLKLVANCDIKNQNILNCDFSDLICAYIYHLKNGKLQNIYVLTAVGAFHHLQT